MRGRIKTLGVVFFFGALALLVRLFYWQVLKADSLSLSARAQLISRETVSGNRGKILSSDGAVLAGSQMNWLVSLYIPNVDLSPYEIASKLSPILVQNDDDVSQLAQASESAKITNFLNNKLVSWVPLKGRVNRDQKKQLEALGISGLQFEENDGRMYPEGSSSAHLLGFVGKDDKGADTGYFGLEGFYNLILSGKTGTNEVAANAAGVPLVGNEDGSSSFYQGADLVTTVDKPLQLMLERELREGLIKYGSDSGSAVIMDVRTGGILALASEPGFDPVRYFQGSDELFRDPVVSDSFEPGSIMKPIVMAAAIDSGLIGADTVCPICTGPYYIDKYVIRTWNNKYFPGTTMRDVIVHSDNIGMVYVGNLLGTDRLISYLKKFGFGSLTNIDLQGEFGAPLKPRAQWGDVERNTASFGQGIAVTGIQMVKAISAIANGGVILNPHVVSEVRLGNGISPKNVGVGARVISQDAATAMTKIMVSSVREGEAKWAAPRGYELAGKTGTAQIAIGGGYDETKTNASFIGFGPAEAPRFVMLVTLKDPKSSPWAAETAAPLWFRIALNVLHYMGVQPKQ